MKNKLTILAAVCSAIMTASESFGQSSEPQNSQMQMKADSKYVNDTFNTEFKDTVAKIVIPDSTSRHINIIKDGDELCCYFWSNGPQYIWTSFQNCRAIGGSAADNSKCGR